MMNNTINTTNAGIVYGLRRKTVKELKKMAKIAEIKGYSKLNKDDLISALSEYKITINSVVVDENEKDEKKANGDKLVKMLIGAWIYAQRAGNANKHLFFWSKKYNAMIASRKALMKVTNDAIVDTFGEQYIYDVNNKVNNNYWLIIKTYETVADRGFCSVKGSDVFISADQWQKMNAQVDLLKKNAVKAGCKTLKEYICQ